MNRLSVLMLAAALLGAPAFAAAQQLELGGKAEQSFTLPEQPAQYVAKAYKGNEHEAKLGELAQKKGQSAEVRRYGQTLARDHRQFSQQLQTLARQNGWLLEEPKADNELARAMQLSNQALERKLNALHGEAFDQAFLSAMVEDHNFDLAKGKQAQRQYFETPALTRWLRQSEPILQQHLQQAYELLGKASNQAPMGQG